MGKNMGAFYQIMLKRKNTIGTSSKCSQKLKVSEPNIM